jgi:hypothetical protein
VRNAPNVRANRFRVRSGRMASTDEYGNNGMFVLPQKGGPDLVVQVSDGGLWDHVSVSTASRTPTWEEMCLVKRLFFRDDEAVIQYHPPESDYVNCHSHCLHLWRPQRAEIPLPPPEFVGPRDEELKGLLP